MIAILKGKLEEKQTTGIVLDVNGVGYELAVPMSTFCNLPDAGREVRLYVQMVVREDAILLYAFLTREEKSAFQELVKVSGIGSKTALAVLSGMSVQDLAAAVSHEQSDLLTRVPGIGKKTAARLVLELKGKLGPELEAAAVGPQGPRRAACRPMLSRVSWRWATANAMLRLLPAIFRLTRRPPKASVSRFAIGTETARRG